MRRFPLAATAAVFLALTGTLLFGGMAARAAGTVPVPVIEHAIGLLEFNGLQTAYTKAGKPRVKALEAILGADISAAERDAAWKAYKAPKGAPAALPDTASITALNAEVAGLKSDLATSTAGRQRAEIALSVAKRELREVLDANTALQRQVTGARAEAAQAKMRYTGLMADAQADRTAAAEARREAKATLADALAREAGAGPPVNRSCRKPLERVLNAGFTWAGNLSTSRDEVANARAACLPPS